MMNRIDIMGRLTRDPETRYTKSETPVTRFTIACDRDYIKGEERGVDFIDCVTFGRRADFIAKYFQKGNMIAVTGRLAVNDYKNADGEKRRSWNIEVDNAYFCGSRNKGDSDKAPRFEEIDDDGELPF